MLLGVIADDFTGASDIANTLVNGQGADGLRLAATQYLGIPEGPADPTVEAGVIALKSRSIPGEAAVRLSLAALDWLKSQGCRQIVFKYCSTFDSTSQGNIGPVAEALAKALNASGVVVCPAFPTAGRTVYRGHLFVHDRLLNESGMEKHPLNPMTDPDLRRWLSAQTSCNIGLVRSEVVRSGTAAVRAELEQAARCGETLVVVDAATDEDLVVIGSACRNAPLLTGGSGIALGLTRNFAEAGLTQGGGLTLPRVDGPEAILAGSCSVATREQVRYHARSHPTLKVDINRLIAGKLNPRELADFVHAHRGDAPLIYSSSDPESVERSGSAKDGYAISSQIEGLFARTAKTLVDEGVQRLVVAGGETSGAVVSALDLQALSVGPEIDPGVPVLVGTGGNPIALALKSGNFGDVDFFSRALKILGNDA